MEQKFKLNFYYKIYSRSTPSDPLTPLQRSTFSCLANYELPTVSMLLPLLLVGLATCALSRRVLVVGATGRLGRRVVQALQREQVAVRALIRGGDHDFDSDVEVVQGNVLDSESLQRATQDCDAVISVQGMKPLRFSKLQDLIRHPSLDPLHPYNVNYMGTKNILSAMKSNQVKKIVRITGSAIGKGELYLFKALFNLILSFTVKWHERTEIAIRESGLDYTILRPNELVEDPSAREFNRTLVLHQNFESTKPGEISISDVADLCVESTLNPKLSFSTVVCTSVPGGDGPQLWYPMIEHVISNGIFDLNDMHADQARHWYFDSKKPLKRSSAASHSCLRTRVKLCIHFLQWTYVALAVVCQVVKTVHYLPKIGLKCYMSFYYRHIAA